MVLLTRFVERGSGEFRGKMTPRRRAAAARAAAAPAGTVAAAGAAAEAAAEVVDGPGDAAVHSATTRFSAGKYARAIRR